MIHYMLTARRTINNLLLKFFGSITYLMFALIDFIGLVQEININIFNKFKTLFIY